MSPGRTLRHPRAHRQAQVVGCPRARRQAHVVGYSRAHHAVPWRLSEREPNIPKLLLKLLLSRFRWLQKLSTHVYILLRRTSLLPTVHRRWGSVLWQMAVVGARHPSVRGPARHWAAERRVPPPRPAARVRARPRGCWRGGAVAAGAPLPPDAPRPRRPSPAARRFALGEKVRRKERCCAAGSGFAVPGAGCRRRRLELDARSRPGKRIYSFTCGLPCGREPGARSAPGDRQRGWGRSKFLDAKSEAKS